MMRKSLIPLFAALCLLVACGPRKAKESVASPTSRDFVAADVPAMISGEQERHEYIAEHYLDKVFTGDWTSDAEHIGGIPNAQMEEAVSMFVSLQDGVEMSKAQGNISRLFGQIESYQQKDTASLFYLLMTELVASYLYDPNSPLRSEDLYLPFVEGMVNSPFTPKDRLAGYEFELGMCRVNPYGSQVPDFVYNDIQNRPHRLYDIEAEHILLFFSNPGCHACQTIIDEIGTRNYIDPMIAAGRLAIVNIYVDQEVDKWREYVHNYPSNWINGYDPEGVIMSDRLYYVRAIPSLYLLDGEKRVVYKDAPVEKVLTYLDKQL